MTLSVTMSGSLIGWISHLFHSLKTYIANTLFRTMTYTLFIKYDQ